MDTSTSDLDFETVEALCQRFYIMPQQLHEAKLLFDHYSSLDSNKAPPLPPSATAATSEAGALPPPQPYMSVKSLEMVFQDLGVIKTSREVRDMIDELTGHIALLDKPRIIQGEAENKPAATPPLDDTKKKTKPTRPASAAGTSSKRKGLGPTEDDAQQPPAEEAEATHHEEGGDMAAQSSSQPFPPPQPHVDGIFFEQFVYLLLASFEEEEEMSIRKEIETSFKKMDVDGNGELSEQDIRQAIANYLACAQGAHPQTYNVNQTDVLQLVANMHSAEMQLALSECDINGDGVVTLPDFALCLLRS